MPRPTTRLRDVPLPSTSRETVLVCLEAPLPPCGSPQMMKWDHTPFPSSVPSSDRPPCPPDKGGPTCPEKRTPPPSVGLRSTWTDPPQGGRAWTGERRRVEGRAGEGKRRGCVCFVPPPATAGKRLLVMGMLGAHGPCETPSLPPAWLPATVTRSSGHSHRHGHREGPGLRASYCRGAFSDRQGAGTG